jgi:Ca-activated chloride channel family protein
VARGIARVGSFGLLLCLIPVVGLLLVAPSVAPGASSADDDKVSITPRGKTDDPKPAVIESRPGSLRIDTTLVQINVTVTDPLNRFVTGLEKEHFRLFEDKIEQKIRDFSSEDAPLSIGLVFDTSGSMGPKLQKSRQAAVQFFKTANPEDEFFLVEFNDRPELVVPFTADKTFRTVWNLRSPKGKPRCWTASTWR